jgi:lipopolysaccharide export system protein LptA
MTRYGGLLMKKIIMYILIIMFVSIILNGMVLAVEKEQEKEETVHLKAGHLIYKKDKIIVSEKVSIIKGEINFKASVGEIKKDENYVYLYDGVFVGYADGNIEADNMAAWLDENKYVFNKSVVLNYQPEDKEGFILKASYLEMFTDDNSFIAKESVIIDQGDRELKAKEARYEDKEQIMRLNGDVYIEEDGDWIKSNKAVFYLASDDKEFSADGEVEIEFKINK